MDDCLYSPVDSGKIIASNAKFVKIKQEKVAKLANEIVSNFKAKSFEDFSYGNDELHPTSKDSNAVDWIFVIDTLNFCFWSYSNKPKWTVNNYTGYYALTAAIRRAIDEGYDITNPKYYASMKLDDLKHILRSDNSSEIEVPLISTRLQCLHEVGNKLLEKYKGSFENCIKEANKSAVSLLKIITENFPCYRDEAVFESKKVSFYKRAQILIADIWACFNHNGIGEFSDINKITMFADYRVPQVLVYYGILEYDRELCKKLEKDEVLENESREVIEIRGCSIHTVELINSEVHKILASDDNLHLKSINAILIDYFLWLYRRKHSSELEHIPFHKVFCQYY